VKSRNVELRNGQEEKRIVLNGFSSLYGKEGVSLLTKEVVVIMTDIENTRCLLLAGYDNIIFPKKMIFIQLATR
jgi:hypothetical protein